MGKLVGGKTVPVPKVDWFIKDASLAYREGWGIFNGSEIQRDDCPDDASIEVLDSDNDAINLVCIGAMAGSRTHVKALILHMRTLKERCAELLLAAQGGPK